MSSRDRTTTLTSKIEHAEIDEHLDKIAKNLIVGDLFYAISIATNNRTRPPFFSGSISWTWMKSCLNIQWTIISSDAGLASTRWQAISRNNDDLIYCCVCCVIRFLWHLNHSRASMAVTGGLGPVSILRPSFPGMGIPMLKIRRSVRPSYL